MKASEEEVADGEKLLNWKQKLERTQLWNATNWKSWRRQGLLWMLPTARKS
ncbi:hypothetical protein Droror1_Dr00013047 [Drosera rotundifolia]